MAKLSHSNPDWSDCGVKCSRCTLMVDPETLDAEAADLCGGDPICADCAEEVFEENGTTELYDGRRLSITVHGGPSDPEARKALARRVAGMEAVEEALITLAEYRKSVQGNLGEAIHTGLRKGTDRPGAHDAWTAIQKMDGRGWSEAVSFAHFGMEYGLEKRLKAAEEVIASLTKGEAEHG